MAEIWNDYLYKDVLKTDGFELDYAVLTTYSLDMPTLLSVPFMMSRKTDLTDVAVRQTPHVVMDAIEKTARKMVVFCNAGCITVPQKHSKVYSLLERSVVQINLPSQGKGFVNFHPKIWVVKETHQETRETHLKVVVLSRNLTASNDLDVVCELVGRVGSSPASSRAQQKHAPLRDFLLWLSGHVAGKEMKNQIRRLAADLEKVESFCLEDSPFEDYDFFPMGFGDYSGGASCLESEMLPCASEMVVISPFIDQSVLSRLAACSPKSRKTLITRHYSVIPSVLPLFNDGVYVPKEVLTDRVEKDVSVDLHEKVYFIRNYQTCLNRLYLGSTNATQNGFYRNVEFLLRLDFTPHQSSYDKFRAELIHEGKDCMFEQIFRVEEQEESGEAIENEQNLRQAISAIRRAVVTVHDNTYRVTVYCKKSKLPACTVYLQPLGGHVGAKVLSEELCFEPLTLDRLTEFYVIQVGDLKRLVKIETSGLPVEARDIAIFRSIIDTPERFIDYLAFMLTDDAALYFLERQQLEKELNDSGNAASANLMCQSLYEDMVQMAYRYPDRIASIRSVISKVDTSVIPEKFTELFATFENVLKKIQRL